MPVAPPANEIGSQMLSGLENFLDEIEGTDARALIVYSARERAFCAGADLRELFAAIDGRPYAAYRGELANFIDRIHRVMDRLDALPLTTIGAVHGVCFGGGFELALTLDMLVADPTARFCFPELRLGIVPGFGGVPRLERELPNAAIRDLLLSGRSYGAKKAANLGLVSQVVGRGQALEVARGLAQQVALFDPEVQAAAKAFIKALPVARLAEEKRLFLEMFRSERVVQALGRFVHSEDAMPYLPSEGR